MISPCFVVDLRRSTKFSSNYQQHVICSISLHLVRVFVGTFLRTTPIWVIYMRLNGAQLGRRVWINSLDVAFEPQDASESHCHRFATRVTLDIAGHTAAVTTEHVVTSFHRR